jgi:hypothetical protein
LTEELTARDRKLIAAGEVLGRIHYRGQKPRDASGILIHGTAIAVDREAAIRYATKLANEPDGVPWVGEPYFKEADGWWTVSFKCTKKVAN